MKFILAQKKEMTQKFSEDGTVIPVTKVTAGPCVVTQIKGHDRNGYTSVQVGFGSTRNLSKSVKGHLKTLGTFRYLREFRLPAQELEKLKVGDTITINTFQPGDKIKVTGTSKGKGFQGVVRRWGFHGSPGSHGHKDQLRLSGSIGAKGPAHVFKGTRMGGRMGGSPITVTNLEVVEVDSKDNSIFIKGAVPGARNNLLVISGAGDTVVEVEQENIKTQEQVISEPVIAEVTVVTEKVESAPESVVESKQETS